MSARPAPATRNAFATFRQLQTRWNDNDIYGHVNNAIHYLLFDTAVNGWLLEAGLLAMRDPTHVWIVAETACRYHEEIAFPDRVDAGLRLNHLGGSSVTWEIGLFRNDADWASAEGRFVHVHVRRNGLRPESIPDHARATLKPLLTAS
ncbi:MAG: thioesterase family protein [Pseudomonadota bacterium]